MNAMIIVIMIRIRMITIINIIMIMKIIFEETISKRMSEEIGGMAIQWQSMAIERRRVGPITKQRVVESNILPRTVKSK